MTEVGAFEAKNKLSALLDRVEQGEEIVITRHGRPVARLVPTHGGSIALRPKRHCSACGIERCRPDLGLSIGKPSKQIETHPGREPDPR